MDFNSSGGMRSPFSPRMKPSIAGRRAIGLSSAKKQQSNYMQSPGGQESGDVIYKTPSITLETYGLPLPVVVTEALTFASGDVSARMSPCGWCWVVAGRRVLTWPCQPTLAATARELTLPQTDLAHKADLVVLFYEDDAQLPSCIGVSPEGVVRYWPCVGQEGVYVDVSAELAGQECELLGEPTKSGLVLATTTCTVVLLTPTESEGRATVTCRTLRPPSGWLGGIGRRVSLLFFGSMPAHVDTKLVGVVVLEGERVALVAGGPLLQLWRGDELHEHHLRRALADAYARAHMPHLPHLAPQLDLNSLEITALDVHAGGPHALLLLLLLQPAAQPAARRYAIASVDVQQPHCPRVASLQPLRAPLEGLGAQPRCLPLPARTLLYAPGYVALLPGGNSSEKVECVELGAEGDRVLSAALCSGAPLVFSRKHGVLALRTARQLAHQLSACDSPLGAPAPPDVYDGNLTMYEIDPNEVAALATEPRSKLKCAFLFHLRRDAAAARLLADAFPVRAGGAAEGGGAADGALDLAVAGAARELLDDAPAGDPRWRRATPRSSVALGASAALQLAAQLRDKAGAYALFLEFLRAHGLWHRLGYVSRECGDGVMSTQQLLGAYGERLAGARALRRLHEEGAHLVDAALQQVASGAECDEWRGGEWSEEVAREDEEESAALRAGALSCADVALRRVSRAHRILRAVARAPPPPGDARAAAAHATAALQLLAGVLSEVHTWRAQWLASGGPPPPSPPADPALHPALLQLHTRATKECARACSDATLRALLLDAAAAFADLLLADALAHAHEHDPAYQALRRDVIKPYVAAGQKRRAAALAEKFRDFELLVQLCVAVDDLKNLHAYIDKYSDQGLAEIAFAWLASGDGGKRALLVRSVGARVPERLARWLAAAPERAQLLALHELGQRRPHAAARALAHLTADSRASVRRAATGASLAKLCLLASEEHDEAAWSAAEWQLGVCEQQGALPPGLRARTVRADDDDGPLLTPEELLQLYVEAEGEPLTEYDYKKALDLTEFIEDPEQRDQFRLQVWCACVERGDWARCASEAAGDELRATLLYRLAELVHLMGGELEQWLPPLGALLAAPRLARRAADPRFHFAIKLAYEYIHDAHDAHDTGEWHDERRQPLA